MSSLLEMLGQHLTGSATQTISRQLGADPKQTQTAIAAAIPTLIEALGRQAAQPGKADGLHQALTKDHDGSLLDNLSEYLEQGSAQNPRAAAGDRILTHVLGDRTNQVAAGVGKLSGLDAATTTKLLAMLAPMVLGALGRQSRQQGLNSGQIVDMLKRERTSFQQGDPQQASMFGKMLDQDGDGDFDASDMMRLGASMLGRFFK